MNAQEYLVINDGASNVIQLFEKEDNCTRLYLQYSTCSLKYVIKDYQVKTHFYDMQITGKYNLRKDSDISL